MQQNHLWTERADVARRWQSLFAAGLRIGGLDELPARRRPGPRARSACGLWIDFDLFVASAAPDALHPSERADYVVVLDPRPSPERARQAFARRAHGYCHAFAAPDVLRRVAESVGRGELWIGREWMDRIAHAVKVGKVPIPAR